HRHDRPAERLPADVRFHAAQHHEIALAHADHEAVVGWPRDRAGDTVDQLDVRSVRLVVDVLVGFDERDPERVLLADEPVGGAGRGVAGVVPTRERGHEHRVAKLRTPFPHQPVGHRVSLRLSLTAPVYSAAMALCTADEYRASLDDGRTLWYRGRRVPDILA